MPSVVASGSEESFSSWSSAEIGECDLDSGTAGCDLDYVSDPMLRPSCLWMILRWLLVDAFSCDVSAYTILAWLVSVTL